MANINTQTNLPAKQIQDSGARTKLFFDTYGVEPLSYKVPDIDASINFFESKGFDSDAALISAAVLLKQAKLDNVDIFKILDDLKGFTELEISGLVSEILNNNRPSTSTLGYRKPISDVTKQRNVVP